MTTRRWVAMGIVLNVTALAVLFWLVLDVRANTDRRPPTTQTFKFDFYSRGGSAIERQLEDLRREDLRRRVDCSFSGSKFC